MSKIFLLTLLFSLNSPRSHAQIRDDVLPVDVWEISSELTAWPHSLQLYIRSSPTGDSTWNSWDCVPPIAPVAADAVMIQDVLIHNTPGMHLVLTEQHRSPTTS